MINCDNASEELEYEEGDGDAAPVCILCDNPFEWNNDKSVWNHPKGEVCTLQSK